MLFYINIENKENVGAFFSFLCDQFDHLFADWRGLDEFFFLFIIITIISGSSSRSSTIDHFRILTAWLDLGWNGG